MNHPQTGDQKDHLPILALVVTLSPAHHDSSVRLLAPEIGMKGSM